MKVFLAGAGQIFSLMDDERVVRGGYSEKLRVESVLFVCYTEGLPHVKFKFQFFS